MLAASQPAAEHDHLLLEEAASTQHKWQQVQAAEGSQTQKNFIVAF